VPISRRELLAASVVAAVSADPAPAAATESGWKLCLNTSTIRGQKLSLPDEIDLAVKAGYQAIEPWVNEVDKFVAGGGKPAELRRRASDQGLAIADLIGFPEWIVDDSDRRKRGLAEARRAMELARELGCPCLAAPPIGAHDARAARIDPLAVADRYHQLAEVGASLQVRPLVEVWGFAPNLTRLSDAALVAIQSGHLRAGVLPDVYHLRRGGSPVAGLGLLAAHSIGIFHVNDYPAGKSPETLVDGDRVFPGDGAADWAAIFAALRRSGFSGFLSLELFNAEYWKRDPGEVARVGREKLQALVDRFSSRN
jgi:sugar phosphate isomerase/epimerase